MTLLLRLRSMRNKICGINRQEVQKYAKKHALRNKIGSKKKTRTAVPRQPEATSKQTTTKSDIQYRNFDSDNKKKKTWQLKSADKSFVVNAGQTNVLHITSDNKIL